MEKKKLIQIAIIVIAFSASGLVLYNGFKTSTPLPQQVAVAPAADIPASGAATGATNPLLPYGATFDVSGVLKKRPLEFDAVSYPTVTSSEIGIYDDVSKSYVQPLVR